VIRHVFRVRSSGIPQLTYVERVGDVMLYNGFSENVRQDTTAIALESWRHRLGRWTTQHERLFSSVLGPLRWARFLCRLMGREITRWLLLELPDNRWLQHTSMGWHCKEQVDGLLGDGTWKYLVDHRTIRFTGETQWPLWDWFSRPILGLAEILRLVGKPDPMLDDFDTARALRKFLGFEERERYNPPGTDWEAQVMWVPSHGHTSFF
jgi:hypothetical protein